MLAKMNPVVDPCANFYLFACGGRISDAASMPPDKPKWNAFSEVELKNLKALKKVVSMNQLRNINTIS